MKKILFLITSLDFGGAEMILRDLAMGLDRDKLDPVVVSIKPLGDLAKPLLDAGYKVHSLDQKGKFNPLVLWRLVKVVKQERPNLVNAHLYHAVVLARCLKVFWPRLPIISTLHNEYQGGRRRERILRYSDFLSEATTTISKKISAIMVERGVVPKDKVKTLYNGVDFDRFFKESGSLSEDDFKKEVPLEAGERLIVAWGRCVPAKGFDLLIRSLRVLRDQGIKVSALIIGQGPEYESLKVLVSNLELEKYVFLAGYKENSKISAYLKYADLFVAPSRWEGMPVVIIEAMAARLPVAAVGVGGTPELVIDGQTGILIDHSEKRAIAEGIKRLLSLPDDERKKMIDAAERNVRENFSVASMVRAYSALFDSYLSRRKKIVWVANSKNDIYFNFFEALGRCHPELDLVMVISAREEGEEDKGRYRLLKFKPRGRIFLKLLFLPRVFSSLLKGKRPDLPNLNVFRGLGSFLKRERPDLVLGNFYFQPTCWTALLYCLLGRVPFCLMEEKKVYLSGSIKTFFKMLPMYLLSPIFWLSRNVFCLSEDCFVFGRMHFPVIDKDKIRLLPAGIDTGVFYDRKEKKSDGRLRILMVARMVPFKRYEDLFKAAKSLKDRGLFDFVVNVRGDGPMESGLKKLVDDLDLGPQVVFLPPLPNSEMPEKIYAANDIIVLPSVNEPIGIVVPEAMACGLPAIVSDTCGCKTYIEDGVNGYIFKTGDYFDLAEKIVRLSDDRRRQAFSETAANAIKDRFSQAVVAEDFHKTVRNALWP